MRTILAALAALALLAGAAGAEVVVQGVRWQVASREKQEAAKPADVAELELPGGKLPGRLVARVKLLNHGNAVEGVLLRYALTPQIGFGGPTDSTQAPVWAVPFVVDEKRVPRIAANQFLEVVIDLTNHVNLQLKRLARDGFALHQLQLQVMVAPRRGEQTVSTTESRIPVR